MVGCLGYPQVGFFFFVFQVLLLVALFLELPVANILLCPPGQKKETRK